MKKYFLMMLMVFSVCAVADPASARGRMHVVVSHGYTVVENVMVEEYPEYYVSYRTHRQYRHRCHHCHYRPRAHRQVRYYHAPDYYYVPQQEVVVYQQVHHWGW